MLIGISSVNSLVGALVGLFILVGWVCHIIMCINWVCDKHARNWVVICGTLAGVLGMVFWPAAYPTINSFGVADIVRAAAIGIAFTLPCFLLAVYLVWFHLYIACSKN